MASRWTLVTSGQVASMTLRFRSAATTRTDGATPCALKTTCAPEGTSSTESTKTAPREASSRTTLRLWTISFRT